MPSAKRPYRLPKKAIRKPEMLGSLLRAQGFKRSSFTGFVRSSYDRRAVCFFIKVNAMVTWYGDGIR